MVMGAGRGEFTFKTDIRNMKLGVCMLSLLFLVGSGARADSAKTHGEVRVSSQELQEFVRVVMGDLIFVEGREFQMGDYGSQFGPEKLPYDVDKDSKPLHKVQLTSYSIEKFKVTNHAFQLYLKYNGRQLRQDVAGSMFKTFSMSPKNPAHMDWHEANEYCNWLADISSLPSHYQRKLNGNTLRVVVDNF